MKGLGRRRCIGSVEQDLIAGVTGPRPANGVDYATCQRDDRARRRQRRGCRGHEIGIGGKGLEFDVIGARRRRRRPPDRRVVPDAVRGRKNRRRGENKWQRNIARRPERKRLVLRVAIPVLGRQIDRVIVRSRSAIARRRRFCVDHVGGRRLRESASLPFHARNRTAGGGEYLKRSRPGGNRHLVLAMISGRIKIIKNLRWRMRKTVNRFDDPAVAVAAPQPKISVFGFRANELAKSA